MIGRIGSVIVCVALASTAMAEPAPRAEKQSPRPVQPAPNPLPPQVMGTELFKYSPWVKLCGRDKSEPAAPLICLTMMEVRREVGPFAAGAALIEGAGEIQGIARDAAARCPARGGRTYRGGSR